MSELTGEWKEVLSGEFKKAYYRSLYEFVKEEYGKYTIYPPADKIFEALHLTALSDIKVVILGQDPYHGDNQAHGLSFSVPPSQKRIPPSLVNIYKELQDDVGTYIPNNGNLLKWTNQGVFLLNTILTVRAHKAFSHQGKGWENFTDAIIKIINDTDRPIVFMLWGSAAISKSKMLNNPKHLVLTAAHPSPLSAYNGFFACKHFSKTNEFLTKNNIEPIDWQIDNLKG